ncbi:hypothetical protein DDF62_07040 [Caulobacter radicis]|nr:hypothetical protein DDF62_07040 [Caulobacter radicis]
MRGTYGELLALHLLIEATIEDCLKVMLPNPRPFLERDPSFAMKLALFESLFSPSQRQGEILAAARTINTTRNQIAHGDEPAVIEKAIDRICQMGSKNLGLGEFDAEPQMKRLAGVAIKVCGFLLGMVEGATGQKPPSQIGVED